MQLTEKKYISTFSPLFKSICEVISPVFSKYSSLLRGFLSKNNNNGGILLNKTAICVLKRVKRSKNNSILLNKELNTATVYINGSNHNLVYAASACRLHPGPTLYRQKAF
jgi:hypothetical protein